MKQHIFLGDAYLGAREIQTWVSLGGDSKVANSYALFCPNCAAIWARLMHEHKDAYCQAVTCRCAKHAIFPSDGTITTQSPYLGDPRRYTPDGGWPRAALLHDVESLSNYFLNHKDRYPYESR